MWLRTKLKAIELIINTSKFTECDLAYWENERRIVLQEILAEQLRNWK